MKLELADILACPMCNGTLTIEVKKQRGKHALYGFSACPGCMHRFEIRNIGLYQPRRIHH